MTGAVTATQGLPRHTHTNHFRASSLFLSLRTGTERKDKSLIPHNQSHHRYSRVFEKHSRTPPHRPSLCFVFSWCFLLQAFHTNIYYKAYPNTNSKHFLCGMKEQKIKKEIGPPRHLRKSFGWVLCLWDLDYFNPPPPPFFSL